MTRSAQSADFFRIFRRTSGKFRREPTSDDDPHRREEELISIIPRNRRLGFDVRRLLGLVFDRESVFEIGRYYGRPLVTALARFNGYPVGVLASDPEQGGGALDAAGSEKMTRFVDLCDTFHLPVVNFVDQPGFLIGTRQSARVPPDTARERWPRYIKRPCPGSRSSCEECSAWPARLTARRKRLNLRYAWPSGDWGSLPIEGGVQAAYRRDIELHPIRPRDAGRLKRQLNDLRSPFRTAEAFGVEEIIDPRDTRPLLCEWVELAYELIPSRLGPKRRGMRP